MEIQLQRLKKLLHETWSQGNVIIKDEANNQSQWANFNDIKSYYLREHIQLYFNDHVKSFMPENQNELMAHIQIETGIWREIQQREAQKILLDIIALRHTDNFVVVDYHEAEQMVNDIFTLFGTFVSFYKTIVPLTYAPYERSLFLVNCERLLFVMRIEK
jgi:hypothetical protein